MDHTDADNVKPTDECHEVHNVDESDILVGKLFSSRDQARYFYKGFAREHGFSARKGTRRLDVEENVKTQEFCCSKEGFRVSKVNIIDRQRAHTPVTRIGCKAIVIVTTTNTNDQWVISKSYQKHNHALCTPAMTPFMLSNRVVSKADIDEATTLKEVGVGTSQVMNYLTQQAGGYHNVGFTHKDLYNALQRGKTKEIVDGDVNALIVYFDYKKHDDPRAMQRAIKSVIPNTKHRLCSWHLSRNAQANIGDPKFTTTFSKCIASWWTTDEFDIQWHSVVSEFNVEKHQWVIEKGNTRHLWAQAYLTGHFFANIRSTQRCESMNASLAIALKHKKTYSDVVRAIEDGISRMRLNELKADYLRWTKDAKASAPQFVDLNVPQEIMKMARFASLRVTTSLLCYAASKTDTSFKTARDEMKRLTEEFENSFGLNDSVNRSSILNNVCDRQWKQRKRKEVTKNKVEKKIRRRGFCNGEGHNKLTCPQVKLGLNTST
ncbi:hypothetical protein F3Y22_tig00001825pilonHSYRG00159 [Hibiscus syriacus]|uniref:FAR1 domain-containing protein n=1 Tax=Hibiscus syriacus TaxID=106335 RepID=A0A6A3CVU3_HIBSY|nr:hypothetical protein F3Y22_tig00001825pilonHSYRG00159 [Hibiscus syriacus]